MKIDEKSMVVELFAMLGYKKPCDDPLWFIMDHDKPLWSTMTQNVLAMTYHDPLWATMTQNLVDYFILTQEKGMISNFPKFSPQKTFLGQIWARNLQVLCFKWNSVRKTIQWCWFWIQQLFS